MFNPFKPKPPITPTAPKESLTLHLSGMHCTSCAVNIDLALEDIPGITQSSTNYQKSTITIHYDPNTITPEAIGQIITDLGYQIT
jgi:P-type Cu+ transporter